jgi:hypothetical protein
MPQESKTGVPFEKDGVRGFLQLPPGGAQSGLVLTHGAGSNCGAPILVAVANAFFQSGIAVTRYDLAFRLKRPKVPPSPATGAAERARLRTAAQALRVLAPGKLYFGGHLYAADKRACSRRKTPRSPTPYCCCCIRCVRRTNPSKCEPRISRRSEPRQSSSTGRPTRSIRPPRCDSHSR